MEIITNSPAVRNQENLLELLLSDHNVECPTCVRNLNCELKNCLKNWVSNPSDIPGKSTDLYLMIFHLQSSVTSKCILCHRCISTCHDIQGVGVIASNFRGFHTVISPVYNMSLAETPCVNCANASYHVRWVR